MEQNQILGYLGGLFQKNAPITDEVFSALKECLKPRNLDTNDYVSGETVHPRRHRLPRLPPRQEPQRLRRIPGERGRRPPFVFLTIESEDGHFSSRHSKLTFKINETGYANAILECSSRNGEDWYAYEIPTMLGVGAAYYALLSWEAYQGIKTGRLEAVVPEDDWNSYLEDYPEVENDQRTEEECLTSALMLLAQSAEEASEYEDEEGDE